MKTLMKFVLGMAVLLPFVSHAQSTLPQLPQVYVKNVIVGSATYKAGDTVKGVFTLANVDPKTTASVYYVISYAGDFKVNGVPSTIYDAQKQGVLTLSPSSSQTVPFQYVLPVGVSGEDMGIVISTYTEAGIPLGFGNTQFKVTGDAALAGISSAAVIVGTKTYSAQLGPTVNKNDTPKISVTVKNTTPNSLTLTPDISIYEGSQIGALVKSLSGQSATLAPGTSKTFLVALPVFDTAGVYAGTFVVRDTAGVQHSVLVNFQYIVGGESARIQSISADQSSVKVGDVLSVSVSYTGSPYNIDTLKALQNNGTLVLKVVDASNNEIASGQQPITMSASADTDIVPLKVTSDASAFSVIATINDAGGKALVTMTQQISSPSGQTTTSEAGIIATIILWSLVVLAAVVVIILVLRMRMRIGFAILVVAFGALSLFGSVHSAQAFTVTATSAGSGANFLIPYVFVNTPVDYSQLNPGQQFYLTGSVVASACTNVLPTLKYTVTYLGNTSTYTQTYGTITGDVHTYTAEGSQFPVIGPFNAPTSTGTYKVFVKVYNDDRATGSSNNWGETDGYQTFTVGTSTSVTTCSDGSAPDANGNCEANKVAYGHLDGAVCVNQAVYGWACQTGSGDATTRVDFYADSNFNTTPQSPGTFLGAAYANTYRGDLVSGGLCDNTPDHGFSLNLSNTPTGVNLMDGKNHTIYAFAVATVNTGNNPLLQGSPITINCPATTPTNSPVGSVDSADCNSISGWTCDADNLTAPVSLNVYKNGAAGIGTYVGAFAANTYRPDVAVAGVCGVGNTYHGFSIPTPTALKTGTTNSIYVYGINVPPTGTNTLLPGSVSKSINCPVPPMPVTCTPPQVLSPTTNTCVNPPTNPSCTYPNLDGTCPATNTCPNPVNTTNLIKNSSFSAVDLTGLTTYDAVTTLNAPSTRLNFWTVTQNSVDVVGGGSGLWPLPSGAQYSIDLIGTPGAGSMYQNVPTVPGGTYTLNFSFAVNPDQTTPTNVANATFEFSQVKTIRATFSALSSSADTSGTVISTYTKSAYAQSGQTISNTKWQTLSTTFTATSNWTQVKVEAVDPNSPNEPALYRGPMIAIPSLVACTLPPASTTPTVTLQANPPSITAGSSTILSWISTNATRCNGTPWTTSTAANGSQFASPVVTTTYSIVCYGPGGTSTPATATVTVIGTPSSGPTTPTGLINASPSCSVNPSVRLTWDASSNTTGYHIYRSIDGNTYSDITPSAYLTITPPLTSGTGFPAGDFTDTNAVAGTLYYYKVASTNGLVTSAPSAPITVNAPSVCSANTPSVSLVATPSTVNSGNSSVLTWTSANVVAGSCKANWTSPVNGSVADTNSVGVTVLPTTTTTYTINCLGTNGNTVTDSKTVTVTNNPPGTCTSNCGGGPTTITPITSSCTGNSCTISWLTPPGQTCAVSGNPNPVNGSGQETVPKPPSDTTYTLSCPTGTFMTTIHVDRLQEI